MPESVSIPVGEPLTFERFKELNAETPSAELAKAFNLLPDELREQAWTHLRLRLALDDWAIDPAMPGDLS